MKEQRRYIFEIPSSGSSVSDDGWRETSARHIETWKRAVQLLSEHHVRLPGAQINLAIDWVPVLSSFNRYYRTMDAIESHLASKPNVSWFDKIKFQRRRTRVPCDIAIEAKSEKNFGVPVIYLESFLYNVFLIMNIADPGSCEFYRSRLKSEDEGVLMGMRGPTEFSLSGAHFQEAVLRKNDGKWPITKEMPLETVLAWFSGIRSGVSQVPKNRMEKVLFGLWYLCSEELNQTSVVWLFYSLETLLDTRPNENRSALYQRICMLLEPTEKQAQHIKRKLDDLYEYRSGLVHGGLEVYHPLELDILDSAVDKKYHRLMEVIDFGFAILLITLQTVIEKGWQAPKFVSSLRVENSAS